MQEWINMGISEICVTFNLQQVFVSTEFSERWDASLGNILKYLIPPQDLYVLTRKNVYDDDSKQFINICRYR